MAMQNHTPSELESPAPMAPAAKAAPTEAAIPVEGYVYVNSPSGHRQSYLDLLATSLDLKPVCQPLTYDTARKLIASQRLFLATFDDDMPRYVLVAAARSLAGRPTVALFLGPRQCFKTSSMKYRLKYLVLRLICKIPRLKLLSIIPFQFEPQCARVAHDDVRDPQWWDMHDGQHLKRPADTQLSRDIARASSGRRIVCMPGSLTTIKGFRFYADILNQGDGLSEHTLFVAAGALPPENRDAGERFTRAGGLLIDRLLDNDEIESLYGVADLIWCCYTPDYDHSSGIFGRALQYGVPTFVRTGALIDRVASSMEPRALRVDYGDAAGGAHVLAQPFPPKLSTSAYPSHTALIGSWRLQFLKKVSDAFQLEKT